MLTPMRSLTLARGFWLSSFATTSATAPFVTRFSRTSGVRPISSVTSFAIFIDFRFSDLIVRFSIRLSPSHPRQDAPHFLRRNREPSRHARHFAAFALPDPRNNNLRKFFADLPERLLAHRALRPRLQRRMNTSLPKNLRT